MNDKSRSTHRRFARGSGLVSLALLLSACGAQGPTVDDFLDPQTGVTVTRATEPLVLYHDNSGAAAHARDYIYVAPLEVNRMGSFRYYIWMAAWGTIASGDPTELRDLLESVVIFADGEPLSLELAGWTPAAAGMSEAVYPLPAAAAVEAYYAVTLDQIRLIANSADIRLQSRSTTAAEYAPWDNRSSAMDGMRTFVDEVRF